MLRVKISGMPSGTDVKRTLPVPSIDFAHTPRTARRNTSALLSAFSAVLQSGTFLHGRENDRLTNALTAYFGTGQVIPVASGHDALFLALSSLHLTGNDEILIPANSPYSVFPAALTNAKIVLYDADTDGKASLASIEKQRTPRTKALIITHLYGLICNMDEIRSFCKAKHLTLIEDVAQGFGGTWKQRKLGTLGDIGCFSFYPTKNLGGLGDGGAVWVRDKTRMHYILDATRYGARHKYDSTFLSGHSRIPELVAASITIFLKQFAETVRKRQKVALWYTSALRPLTDSGVVRVLESHPASVPVRHLYVLDVPKRDALRVYLDKHGIPTLVHYPYPAHRIPSLQHLGYRRGDFPVSEMLSRRILSLPYHEHLTRTQITYITDTIRSFYEKTA